MPTQMALAYAKGHLRAQVADLRVHVAAQVSPELCFVCFRIPLIPESPDTLFGHNYQLVVLF